MPSLSAEEVLRAPLSLLTDPGERTYWPYLVVTFVMAAMVLVWRLRRHGRRPTPGLIARMLFDPGIWWHPSARLDYKIVAVKLLFGVVAVTPWALTAFGVAIKLVGWLDRRWGVPATPDWPGWMVTAIYTVSLFVAWDLSRYLLHRWLHTVPWLWRFHSVHHSAEVMTPLTLFRTHPVESLLFNLRGTLVTGVITGVFFYWFRGEAVQTTMLGVNVFGAVFNLAGANLRHSHIWWSWGPRVERWLISPAQHQIHHAVEPHLHNKNLGSWLAIWDRLGGTLVTATAGRPRAFGVAAKARNHAPDRLWSALLGPLRKQQLRS